MPPKKNRFNPLRSRHRRRASTLAGYARRAARGPSGDGDGPCRHSTVGPLRATRYGGIQSWRGVLSESDPRFAEVPGGGPRAEYTTVPTIPARPPLLPQARLTPASTPTPILALDGLTHQHVGLLARFRLVNPQSDWSTHQLGGGPRRRRGCRGGCWRWGGLPSDSDVSRAGRPPVAVRRIAVGGRLVAPRTLAAERCPFSVDTVVRRCRTPRPTTRRAGGAGRTAAVKRGPFPRGPVVRRMGPAGAR